MKILKLFFILLALFLMVLVIAISAYKQNVPAIIGWVGVLLLYTIIMFSETIQQ